MARMTSFQRVSEGLYDHLAADIEKELAASGLDGRLAARITGITIRRMAETFGGTNIYFPKDMKRKIELRDEAIFAEFETVELHTLAAKHDLSEMRIRQIIYRFNEEIINQFDGNNIDSLADQYGVTRERIARITFNNRSAATSSSTTSGSEVVK